GRLGGELPRARRHHAPRRDASRVQRYRPGTARVGEGELGGRVRRRLAARHPVAALLGHVRHAAPPVGGTPTDADVEVIRELESMDRERYAGPVGWVDADGNGEWGIALRCAQLDGTGRGCSPGAVSSPAPTPPPSWRRPSPSSAPCAPPWS